MDFEEIIKKVQWLDDQERKSKTEIGELNARIRLCPYYFVDKNKATLGGVLSTACPKNKKLIHGMIDAVISPCYLKNDLESE